MNGILVVIIVIWLILIIKMHYVCKYRIMYMEYMANNPNIVYTRISSSFNKQIFNPFIWTYKQVKRDLEKTYNI